MAVLINLFAHRTCHNNFVPVLLGSHHLQSLLRRNSLGRPEPHQPLNNREEGLQLFFVDLMFEFVFEPSVNTKVALYCYDSIRYCPYRPIRVVLKWIAHYNGQGAEKYLPSSGCLLKSILK
jgi:hypothetical protein